MSKAKIALKEAWQSGFNDGYEGSTKSPPSDYSISDFIGDALLSFFTGGIYAGVKGAHKVIDAMGGEGEASTALDNAYERGYQKGERQRKKEAKGFW
jgi:hypothetical protein